MEVFNRKVMDRFNLDINNLITIILQSTDCKQTVNVVKSLADRIPRSIISHLLGIPAQHQQQVANILLGTRTLLEPTHITPRKMRRLETEFEQCMTIFDEVIAENQSSPQQNIISMLLKPGAKGDKLSTNEIRISCALTYIAGHETTKSLIASAARLFATYPNQWQLLMDNPDLLDRAVDEIARIEPPLHFTTRLTTKKLRLGAQNIAEEELLLLCLASANRDPNIFEEPNRFNIAREHYPNLSFGLGMHNCIGRHLALTETKVLLQQMIASGRRFCKQNDYREVWDDLGATTRSLKQLQLLVA